MGRSGLVEVGWRPREEVDWLAGGSATAALAAPW